MSEDQRPPDDSSTGKRLGDFELLRELGRGGMGIVYEARQLSLKRRVALKVLPPALGMTAQAKQRFEREAQAAAKLHHTNIVPVHAIGEHDGHHFYAMELIDGQSLDHVLREMVDEGANPLIETAVTQTATELRPQRPATTSQEQTTTSLSDTSAGGREWFDTVAKLVADVADALHYAHGRGVIHRDVKPANLMLSRDGHLSITDFGLARLLEEPGMTVSGSFLGTPAYMAPEQIAAGRIKIDHRADIYSLGAVLYEMLTMQRPFAGQSREQVLAAVMTKDPRPPRRFNGKIPIDLETICLKALEKDVDRRYATAGEMAQDLRQYLQGGLIAARRAGIARRSWKAIRRHPVASSVAVGLIAVLIVGSFALRQRAGRSEEAARRLVAAAEVDLREGTYRQGLEKIDRALAIAPEMPEVIKTQGRLLFEANSDPRELVRVARAILAENPDDWEAHGWLGSHWLGDVAVDEHRAALERLAPDSADAWYVRGVAAASAAESIRYLDRALELDPGHAWALLKRSGYKRDLHQTAAAIADAERAIAVRPRSARGRRCLAQVYLQDLRDFDRALEEFDKAAAIDPEDWMVYYERSGVYQRGNLGDQEKKTEELRRALELAPNDFRTLAHCGSFAQKRRAVEIEPNYPGSWPGLIVGLAQREQTDELSEALDELRRLAESWPNRRVAAEAYAGLSYFHHNLGDHDAALAAAERAIELTPGSVGAHVRSIYARRALSGEAAMTADCDRLQAVELSEPEALHSRARYLGGVCQRPEAARADFAAAIELAPQWADPFYARGNFEWNRGEYEAALVDLDAAIERAPKWPDPHRMRGQVLNRLERYDEALVSISRAIELSPRHANAILSRAEIRFDLERNEDALEDLERHIELVGGRGTNWRWLLAQTLHRLGRDDEALESTDAAIAARPKSASPYRAKAMVLFSMGRTDEMRPVIDRAVEIAPGDSWNHIWSALSRLFPDARWVDALADLERARELAPDNRDVAQNVAYAHVTALHALCPDEYDGDLALRLAREALEENFEVPARQNTFGTALFRHGRLDEARDAMARAVELQRPKPTPEQLFALAMIEQRMNQPIKARRLYDEALSRMRALARQRDPIVRHLQDEAAKLLGMEPSLPE